jgi:hypothetical protein
LTDVGVICDLHDQWDDFKFRNATHDL